MSRPVPTLAKSTAPVNQGQRTSAVAATAQPKPKTEAVAEEEEAWDQVAAETTKSTSRADTPPRQPRKSSASPRRVGGTTRDGLPEIRRVWIVVGIATAVVLFLVVVAGVVGFILTRRGEANPTDRPAARLALKVGKDGKFKTIADAWKNAVEGDRIVVQGPLEEDLMLEGQDERHRNITIEPEEPGTLTWRPNPKTKDVSHLLVLKNVEGLHLRGITFDGADRCGKSVLLLTGHCPGTSLEDIRIQGFSGTSSGVMIVNCEGDSAQPLTFSKAVVIANPGKPARSAFEFHLDPKWEFVKRNQFLTLRDCRLEGNFEVRLRLSETARGKDSENRERTSLSLSGVVAVPEAGKDPEDVTMPR
jgi:hypothetical protein